MSMMEAVCAFFMLALIGTDVTIVSGLNLRLVDHLRTKVQVQQAVRNIAEAKLNGQMSGQDSSVQSEGVTVHVQSIQMSAAMDGWQIYAGKGDNYTSVTLVDPRSDLS